MKASNRQIKDTITTLTSKEDSLARQYIDLRKVKENLENIALSVHSLRARVVDDKAQGGMSSGKAVIYLKDIPLGTLDWSVPTNLSPNEEKSAVANFTTESIDYVKVLPDERLILRSLGDRMKVLVKLSSPLATMEVRPESSEAQQEVGERDSATWHWKIHNGGTQDARLLLRLDLVNRNSDEIPVFQEGHLVMSSSVVRQVRNYLQPIPVAVGVVAGFLLFGIVGIFRRGKGSSAPRKAAATSNADPKQL